MIRPAREWLPRYYRLDPQSSRQGLFDPSLVPWLMADGGPIAAWDDPAVREIVCMTSAQAGKTVLIQGLLAHGLATMPGPAMLSLPAADEMSTFLDSRFYPVLESGPVRHLMPSKRYAKQRDRIGFPFGLLLGVGAQSGSKLSGKPIRYLVADEEKDYEPGALEKARRRVTSFPDHRILRISTPTLAGANIHAGYLSGSQHQWHVRCPSCGDAHPVTWDRMKWDETAKAFDARAASLHLRCPSCDHVWRDVPEDRQALARDGAWVADNHDAPSHVRSYRWASLIVPWVRWRDVLREVEQARSSISSGVVGPWRVCWTEVLGEPWEEDLVEDPGELVVGEYALGDPWQDGQLRILGVDVQRDRLEVVCRAFARDGSSRLVHEGSLRTWADLADLQRQLDVSPRWVGVDSRYRRAETLRECQRHGWAAMQGDDRDSGYIHDRAPGKPRRAYAPPVPIEVGIGTDRRGLKVVLISWSNRLIKDQLHLLSRGKAGNWTIARDTSPEYVAQMRAERLVTRHDAAGHPHHRWEMSNKRGDNHRWDCECMILTLAQIARVVDGLDDPTDSTS